MMQTLEYRSHDKSAWGPGPWQDEPDKRQWRDEATGLPCLIVRSPMGGNLCGYVGVPREHALHGKDYSERVKPPAAFEERSYDEVRTPVLALFRAPDPDGLIGIDIALDVHGGITFAAGCGHGEDPSRGVCHVPGDGEADDVWWFGFDCAHCNDHSPARSVRMRELGMGDIDDGGTYRDIDYVTREVRGLARQLKEWA